MSDEEPVGTDCDCTPDPTDRAPRQKIQRWVFIGLLAVITGLFLYILKPFFGPILWACVLAILFAPVQRRLLKVTHNRRNVSSILTLLIAVVVCVAPLFFVSLALFNQAKDLYGMIQGGTIDFAGYLKTFQEKIPALQELLGRAGVSPDEVSAYLTGLLSSAGRFITGNTVQFVGGTAKLLVAMVLMVYLLFFMLRDGGRLTGVLIKAIPVDDCRERLLLDTFVGMIRAMVKGTLVIASIQGTLGGITFWALGITAPVLWGVVMALCALIPMLGTWIVWLPVAIYLLVTGAWVKGLILALVGTLVIGLIDNLLRPRLVGRETKIPDWVVLLATLGGIFAFGVNGFIVGPVIAALFLAFWQMFSKEYSA